MLPEDRKYTKEHEWIKMDGDKGTVGITDYAQQQLGDVVYVEIPEIGASVTAMEVFGNIESVKAVSELFSPVTGEILDVNQKVIDTPELVNKDPYGEAWLMVVRVANLAQLDELMSAADYQAYLDNLDGESES